MAKIIPVPSKSKLKSAKEVSEFAESIIGTVREPLLLLDKNLRVVKASRSFYDFFKVTPDETIGTLIYDLGNHQWNIPKLRELLETILPEKTTFDNYEVEHVFSALGKRTMLFNARKIQRGSGKEQIILLAIEDITKRKQSEEALQYSVSILNNVVHTIPDMIWLKDVDGVYLSCNKMIERLFGAKEADILGKSDYEFLNQEQADFFRNQDLKAIAAGKPTTYEESVTFKDDGYSAFLETIKTPMYDEQGTLIGVLGIGRDITRRKLAEEAITSLAKFPDENPQPIVRISRTGSLLYANKACYAILPWKLEIGKSAPAVLHNIVTDIFTQKISKTIEIDYKKQIISVFAVPIMESDYANLYISDITKRKQNEEKRRESELRFKQVSDNAKELIWEVDKNGLYTYVSSIIKELLGYEPEEIIGQKHFYDLFEPGNREELKQGALGAFARKESFKDFVNVNLHRDGREIILSTCGIPMLDNKGNLIGYRGTDIDISERLRAEEAIKESEERFSRLINSTTDMIFLKDDQFKHILVNIPLAQFYGKKPDEIIGLTDFDLFVEDGAKQCRQSDLEALKTNSIYITEEASGDRYFETTKFPVKLKNNKVGVGGFIRDITKRKEVEEAFRESESLYHSFIEQLPNAVFRKDVENRYVLVNSEFCKLKGLKKEDFIGKKPIEVAASQIVKKEVQGHAAEYANLGEDIHKMILQTGEFFENEEEYPDINGSIRYMNVIRMPVFDSAGTIIGTQGIMFDITERKRSEDKISMLAQSLKSINEIVSITDMQDKILFVNEAYLKTYGYDENEMIGKHAGLVISPNNPTNLGEEIFSATRSGGWKGEVWDIRKDGSEFPIYLSTSIIFDKDGKILGLIGVATDITGRKRAEHDLIKEKEKAESANKLKDAFIANISHEIRTPLNGILGMVSLIRDIFPGKIMKEDEELFAGIDHSSRRIIRTVDMILNYSRLQVGEFPLFQKKLELSTICLNLVTEYTTAAKIKSLDLTFQNNCGDVTIFADEYSITMAISNLIDNSIKYTVKGFVNVILHKQDDDNIILVIKDSGIGIEKEFIEKIFDPYRQVQMGYGRAYEGIGLGLSLVKKVLALNNSKLFVESKKGEGTTFSINFGKAVQSLDKTAENVMMSGIPPVLEKPGIKVVLLVEDDEINQITIKKFIGIRYTIVITDSSDEALEILKNKKVDLILMDISIKGEKNGLELTKELKASKEFSHIPVIAVTAHAFEKDKKNALEAGCDSYLAKPFTKKSLLEMIKKYLV
jgi:PAS domain S-box-containing protein